MPNMEARTCEMILVNEVVSRFGVPNKIHSDHGRQFESNVFAVMCELLQIEARTCANILVNEVVSRLGSPIKFTVIMEDSSRVIYLL